MTAVQLEREGKTTRPKTEEAAQGVDMGRQPGFTNLGLFTMILLGTSKIQMLEQRTD